MDKSSRDDAVQRHVFTRCGQAVTRLAEAGLVPWPVVPDSEREVGEWWLVSDDLAGRLRGAGHPVLRFGELNLWGRASGGAPQDDPELKALLRG
jgi:hypothetical protein